VAELLLLLLAGVRVIGMTVKPVLEKVGDVLGQLAALAGRTLHKSTDRCEGRRAVATEARRPLWVAHRRGFGKRDGASGVAVVALRERPVLGLDWTRPFGDGQASVIVTGDAGCAIIELLR
jgi:hypothetical protein